MEGRQDESKTPNTHIRFLLPNVDDDDDDDGSLDSTSSTTTISSSSFWVRYN